MAISITYIGAQWCTSCKTIFPKVQDLTAKFQVPLTVKDLDADLEEDEKIGISKVPTIYIMKDNERIVEYNVKQVESLDNWLRENTSIQKSEDF